ncbi:hypothetical protein ACH5RR_001331 [Cinchona calisaya]|uniref:Chloroplast envelope membrane protein n=1 Tax=Cinchona calisaya TaxID=153742 RepID=A0ABD3B3N0_9GENT
MRATKEREVKMEIDVHAIIGVSIAEEEDILQEIVYWRKETDRDSQELSALDGKKQWKAAAIKEENDYRGFPSSDEEWDNEACVAI